MKDLNWAKGVLEKVDQGKKVSSSDLQQASEVMLKEMEKVKPDLPRFVKNQTMLADIFKVDRKTIQRWRKETGFPKPVSNGKWDVHATHAWIRVNQKSDNVDEEDIHELKIRQLKLICEKLEHELYIKRGDFVANSDVERWVAQMIHESKVILLGIPAKLAPVVAGMEPAEAEARLKEAVDDALTQLHEG